MKHINKIVWVCGAAAVVIAAAGLFFVMNNMDGEELKSRDGVLDLVIGTYGDFVYHYQFNCETMEFVLAGKAEAADASYALAEYSMEPGSENPSGRYNIYAVSEVGAGSGVYSFECQSGNYLTIRKTAERRQSGADPCFIMLYDMGDSGISTGGQAKGDDLDQRSKAEKPEGNGADYMLTADYSGGSISVFPIVKGKVEDRCDQLCFEGRGPVIGRQESSHIHQLRLLPKQEKWNDDYILATDLGADLIRLIYVGSVFSEMKGSQVMLTHVDDIPCPEGSGPRHMEFSPEGKMMYCLAELSGEVLVYEITRNEGMPSLGLVQNIQADEVNAGGSADIHIHPSGKWLYTSHRLDNDGVAIFRIKPDGQLEKTGYCRTSRHPRNFMITPDGDFLLVACRDDRLIQTFRIGQDGNLTPTSAILQFENDMPSSITAINR